MIVLDGYNEGLSTKYRAHECRTGGGACMPNSGLHTGYGYNVEIRRPLIQQ